MISLAHNHTLRRHSHYFTASIFEDKISGKTDQRPGLKRSLNALKSGDTLVVWKMDRLSRSIKHLITLISKLEDKGIHLHSLTDSIDTSSSAGRFFFHVMGELAQIERELIVERNQSGLAAARSRGRIRGRLRSLSTAQQQKAKNYLSLVTVKTGHVLNMLICRVKKIFFWRES